MAITSIIIIIVAMTSSYVYITETGNAPLYPDKSNLYIIK